MSVLDGPGEGTWSVFALSVVDQRDRAREQVAMLRAALKERGCRPIASGNDCIGCKALAATEEP